MEAKRKNKDFNPNNCPVTHFYNKVGGKWKTVILYAIGKNVNRFGMMQKSMPMISKQMLVNQLRELEEDQIIGRTIYAEIPPRVEYHLTEYGESFMLILYNIQDWGLKDMAAKN
ncbi:winged helix-turn-helix transcriptional regulator [Epilithonimonas sp. UC225_85]|uniref:winged helix-turn-helix transcriptional regulator n=1 Tax=Epilithonimonas sp. UC225_85 TaxID=3350167 RepID=UPI0036D3310A